jgi:hypothetical protein
MRAGWRFFLWVALVCSVGLGGCGSSGPEYPSRSGPDPDYLAVTTSGNVGVQKLCSPRTGREVRRIGSYNLTGAHTKLSLTLTANGEAVSPDGRTAYLAVLRNRTPGVLIARVPTTGARPSIVAAGAQPSISPNGRFLAYGTGRLGTVLSVRNLATGVTRSIDLARWIGHGYLGPGGQGNATMTWLSNNTDLAVLPDEGVVWDLVGKRPHPPNNPCSDKQGITSCVLVVHTGRSLTEPLTVTRHVLPVGFDSPLALGAAHADPHALLAASSPLVVERIDVSTPTATIERLITIHGDAFPDQFNPAGTELIYQANHVSGLLELRIPEDPTSTPSQTILRGDCGTPEAW